jgi:hypothetical protein
LLKWSHSPDSTQIRGSCCLEASVVDSHQRGQGCHEAESGNFVGTPDEKHEWEEGAAGDYDDVVRWKPAHRYSSRWNTLVLDVHEMPDGTISYVIFGQHVGTPPNEVPDERRHWWQFWRKRGA